MKKKIMTMAMMALAFTACTKEDLMPPTQGDAGTLHITGVTIDGQEVAQTRVVADGGNYPDGIPYNQSFIGFTNGNKLQLVTNGLSAEGVTTNQFYAIYNTDGTWTINDGKGETAMALKPAEGKKWADVSISAAFGGDDVKGSIPEAYNQVAPPMGVVQGDILKESSIIFSDWLVASTGNGVTIDTDVKSPTLGAVTIQLKHAHALLRLPVTAVSVTSGTYIVNGTAHNVTGLGTLWAVLNTSSTGDGEDGTATTTSTTYIPLTKVKIGETDYLQAIVPSTSDDGSYTLTGFKAVMNVADGGASGEETTQNSATLTLDLPFKVGTSNTHDADGIALAPNTRYPLTLTIAPHTASVSLSSGLGKPGWGTEEEELSNEMNELLITVDGIQYIKIDGTATDVDKVKSIIETVIAAGYTNFYVTGETLAEYSNGTAKSVVGEAIRQLAEGTTVSLVLPDATSISNNAFHYCTSLTSLTFGSVITSVDNNAFDDTFEDGTAWTTLCALTLNIGQKSSTDESLKPSGYTWAGYTWASISYVGGDGNAVEGN